MDPSHNSNRRNMFTRFCINTDVTINVGKKIIIPDENCIPIKYKLWFDDFPEGCGACGLLDHVFEECPNRAIPIPVLKITLRKQSATKSYGQSVDASSSLNKEWINNGKNYKILSQSNAQLKHQNKPYLNQNSGVNFVYEFEESDEMLNLSPELDLEFDAQPHLIFASDGITIKDGLEENKGDEGMNNNIEATNSGGTLPQD